MIWFYRLDPGDARPEPPRAAPASIWWRPREGLPPPGPHRGRNLVWWLLDRLGLFARAGFAEMTVREAGRLRHRLIVTPRWYRFPFMAERDLQIGDLWTDLPARGRRLARAAIGEAVGNVACETGSVWYVVEAGNHASIRLIEACGFRRVAGGRRTRPLGLRALGRYRIDRWLA